MGFASVSILIWTFHNNVQIQAECATAASSLLTP